MRKFKQQFLAGPYLIWIIGFILLPLIMILYYAFTNGDGSFTLSYITAIADETNRKAMGLSLRLGIICTIVCLVLSYPLAMILNNMKIKNQGLVVFIFMLPMWMNFYAPYPGMETSAFQKWCNQLHSLRFRTFPHQYHKYTNGSCPWHGIRLPAIYAAANLQLHDTNP